jgi:hypothetical protein
MISRERELLEKVISGDNKGDFFVSYDLYKEIYEFLAQPEHTEQEPVAWMWDEMFCEDWTTVSSVIKPSKSKYVDNVRPLYLTPPTRQPLSYERLSQLYALRLLNDPLVFARQVEMAHGIGVKQ